jgi:hypothetical protein
MYIIVIELKACCIITCLLTYAVHYQPGAAAKFLSLKAHDRKQFKGKEFFSTGPGHIL